VLSHAVSVALRYANFINNVEVKNALIDEIHKREPLIGIKVTTIKNNNGEGDIEDFSKEMYFAKSFGLDAVIGDIVFMIRHNIDKNNVDKRFVTVKTRTSLSFFLAKSGSEDEEEQPSHMEMMNENQKTFNEFIEQWAVADDSLYSSSPSVSLAIDQRTTHTASQNLLDKTLRIFVKKEMGIERTVFFPHEFKKSIKDLEQIILPEVLETLSATSSNRRGAISKKLRGISWGQNSWILNNYVSINFLHQMQASKAIASEKQERKKYPVYQHTDGFYYMDTGLPSYLTGALVAFRLKEIENTEYQFEFVEWCTITDYSSLEEVHNKLAAPDWKILDIPKTLVDKNDIIYDARDIYSKNQHRFRMALHWKEESEHLEWLTKQLETQVNLFISDTSHAEVAWYETQNSINYCLPLITTDFYKKEKLALVAVLAKESGFSDSNPKFRIKGIIPPVWAYNNARVLRKPRTPWMKAYAATYSVEEEAIHWNQSMTTTETYERKY
ncbi:MAG TPA: DUF3825 domain-containing protein, partial [Myxococcota bacterium]|nr:DUF3825 domain-containing protein [Myxococcota bacterium]